MAFSRLLLPILLRDKARCAFLTFSSDLRRRRGLSIFSETMSSDKDGDEELACLRHRDCRGLDDSLERTMLFELHESDLRKFHLPVLDPDAPVLIVCRVGGAVAVPRFELREPDRFVSEEVGICLIQIHLGIRQRQAIDVFQERKFGLILRRGRELLLCVGVQLRLFIQFAAVANTQ